MKRAVIKYFLVFVCTLVAAYCVKPYEPPELQAKTNYLVVDGFINTGANQVTTITLSRTRSLTDSTTATDAESNASIQIVSGNGSIYPLHEAADGIYQSASLSLDNTTTYQLKITTSNGKEYTSEPVSNYQTPAIDSLTWQQQGDVTVYLYTHSSANSANYYKWDYTEVWQYNSIFATIFGLKGNYIEKLDTSEEIDSCWKTDVSTNILTGTSANLSEDVISKAKIATVPLNDEKIWVRYSINVRQRTIDARGYSYWQIVEKNSQDRGGLFDLQPGQLQGNIHAQTDPTEPVIGYINASSETAYRLFISNKQVNWYTGPHDCDVILIDQDPNVFNYYNYPDTAYAPYHYVSPSGIALSLKTCLDCRMHGGVNKRPPYW